jgi:hypothetical protein
MAKACLFWLLRNLKHDVATEWKVTNGYFNICDKTTQTLFEIEFQRSKGKRTQKTKQYKNNGYELIIIDCSQIPENIYEIQKYLELFIYPD